MNISIWERIAGIPWWIYIAGAYILYLQCLSLRPRTLDMTQAAIPLLSIVSISSGALALQLSLYPQLINYQTNTYLICAVLSGMVLGWIQFKLARIQVLINSKKIHIPSSWVNFILGLVSFAGVWYIKQHYGTEWLTTPPIAILWCALLTGLVGGRLIALSFAVKYA